jgi:malate dehydrogenase (oxaloacetate-decarboxylating)
MDVYQEALELHRRVKGKVEVVSKVPVRDERDLTLAYSPGVAEPCRRIMQDKEAAFELTGRGNRVAVVSDGSAVLGLGNIGPEAALPVMEGKAVLFKAFAGVDAFPLCLATQDPLELARLVRLMEPSFAGINLEDITAPACFVVEETLKRETGMVIFHDDQHGTAVVTLAGLLNALRVVGKQLDQVKVVLNGAGAAGSSIAKILLSAGARDLIVCDRTGVIYADRTGLDRFKRELAEQTNPGRLRGGLAEALRGADVFLGVSVGNVVTREMVRSMAREAIVFALANPEPEIQPALAREAGAEVVATGRSDYPNQVNNVLGFPGIFRGALDVQARDIDEPMKLAAALAIAGLVSPAELKPGYIIPKPFDRRVAPEVAKAVARAALSSGVARREVDPEWVAAHARELAGLEQ